MCQSATFVSLCVKFSYQVNLDSLTLLFYRLLFTHKKCSERSVNLSFFKVLVLTLCSMCSNLYSCFEIKTTLEVRVLITLYPPPPFQTNLGRGYILRIEFCQYDPSIGSWPYCKEAFGIIKLVCCCYLFNVVNEILWACISSCSLS